MRREMLRERLRLVHGAARAHIVTLRQAGFATVASLAACPLESVGLPRDVAVLLRAAHDRLRGEPESTPPDHRGVYGGSGGEWRTRGERGEEW